MATSPLPQVAATAVDVSGVSVCAATPSATDPRAGTAYHHTDFAAAAWVWAHPLADGRYVLLNSRHWYDATPVEDEPGSFSSYTQSLSPGWIVVDGPTGRRSMVSGFGLDVPITTSCDTATLVGAASRPVNHLYLLHALTQGDADLAVVQRFTLSPEGAVSLSVEERLPPVALGAETVLFNKGVQQVDDWLYVYGTDSLGRVYRMRKPWAHVGFNKHTTVSGQVFGQVIGTPQGWEYFTGLGYSFSSADLAPLTVSTGFSLSTMTTVGPMSFAVYRTKVLMTTVSLVDGEYWGQVWMSSSGRVPKKITEVDLGDSNAYLGIGVQLMPLLGATSVATGSAAAGIVYVISTKTSSGGGTKLATTWGVCPVP